MPNENTWQAGFKLHVDKAGRNWIWSEALACNVAIRQPTLSDAYKASMMSLAHYALMYKEDRDRLREQLETLRIANEKVFRERKDT